jgi:hypothetical protein
VAVDTDQIPDDGFESTADGAISRAKFFTLVFEGDIVSLNGNLAGDRVQWKGVELLQE